MNKLDSILQKIESLQNKYPETALYRKLSTTSGIFKQIKNQLKHLPEDSTDIHLAYINEYEHTMNEQMGYEVAYVTLCISHLLHSERYRKFEESFGK